MNDETRIHQQFHDAAKKLAKCRHADAYRAINPPHCNGGNVCTACAQKWADRQEGLAYLTERAEAALRKSYVIRADDRQKSMGLSYVEAETRELARFIARFAMEL